MDDTLVKKLCSICKVEKPLHEFPNNRAARDGKQARCRPCDKTYLEQWRAANPERHATAVRRAKLKCYGITPEQYEELLEEQGGVCAICRGMPTASKTYFHVDHDHATGQVRGLLCQHCNFLLGHARDDPGVLLRATQYLSDWMN